MTTTNTTTMATNCAFCDAKYTDENKSVTRNNVSFCTRCVEALTRLKAKDTTQCECCGEPTEYDNIREKNICIDNGCDTRIAKCCTCHEIWGDENGEFDEDGDFKCEECIEKEEEEQTCGVCHKSCKTDDTDHLTLIAEINGIKHCDECLRHYIDQRFSADASTRAAPEDR